MAEARTSATALLDDVRELCAFEGRRPGTDAERRAAKHLAGRLREIGRRAEIEPTYVHPQVPLVLAAHAALGFAGSLLAVGIPAAGFALVLVSAASLYLDLNTRLYLLRTLFFRRASQNVVSPGSNPDAAARLILAAHYDTGRTGMLFDPKRARRAAAFTRVMRFPPSRLLFWSLAVLLPILGLRMAGTETDAVSIAQLPPTLLLLFAGFLLLDAELADPVPGANDNASGVAVALDLAAELGRDPARNLDVTVALIGGGEALGEGMRSLVRSRRGELDRARTFVIVLDSLGAGDVRYAASEGAAVAYEMDPRLLQLCAAITVADDEGEERYRAAAIRSGFATDALAARVRGLRSVSLTALAPGAVVPANFHLPSDTPGNLDPDALERSRDFALELIRALDRDAGRTAGD